MGSVRRLTARIEVKESLEVMEMFCDRCSGILSQTVEPLDWGEEGNTAFFIHHETYEGLQNAVKRHCHICSLFMQDVVETEQNLLRQTEPKGLVTSAILEKATLLGIPDSFIVGVNLDSDMETQSMKEKRTAPFLVLILQPVADTCEEGLLAEAVSISWLRCPHIEVV